MIQQVLRYVGSKRNNGECGTEGSKMDGRECVEGVFSLEEEDTFELQIFYSSASRLNRRFRRGPPQACLI